MNRLKMWARRRAVLLSTNFSSPVSYLVDEIGCHPISHLTESNESDSCCIRRHHSCEVGAEFCDAECHFKISFDEFLFEITTRSLLKAKNTRASNRLNEKSTTEFAHTTNKLMRRAEKKYFLIRIRVCSWVCSLKYYLLFNAHSRSQPVF